METKQRFVTEAEKLCEAYVQTRLKEGGWISAQEYISMQKHEMEKSKKDAEILNMFY